jgi:hypothetical protein
MSLSSSSVPTLPKYTLFDIEIKFNKLIGPDSKIKIETQDTINKLSYFVYQNQNAPNVTQLAAEALYQEYMRMKQPAITPIAPSSTPSSPPSSPPPGLVKYAHFDSRVDYLPAEIRTTAFRLINLQTTVDPSDEPYLIFIYKDLKTKIVFSNQKYSVDVNTPLHECTTEQVLHKLDYHWETYSGSIIKEKETDVTSFTLEYRLQ